MSTSLCFALFITVFVQFTASFYLRFFFHSFVFSILLASLFHINSRANVWVCMCSPSSYQPFKLLYNNNLVVCKRVRCHVIRHPFVFLCMLVFVCVWVNKKTTREISRRDTWLQPHRKGESAFPRTEKDVQSANTLQMERVSVITSTPLVQMFCNMFRVSSFTHSQKKKHVLWIDWEREQKMAPKYSLWLLFPPTINGERKREKIGNASVRTHIIW